MANLYYFFGSMNSSKSMNLLAVAHNYDTLGMNVLTLTSALDDREKVGVVKSRAISDSREAVAVSRTDKIYDIVTPQTQAIVVDECQFFTKQQIWEFVQLANINNIPVMCYGLRNNFKGEMFEGSTWLMAWADRITEIPTLCSFCGKKARMVLRLVDGIPVFEGEEIQIGDAEYRQVCMECFVKAKMK